MHNSTQNKQQSHNKQTNKTGKGTHYFLYYHTCLQIILFTQVLEDYSLFITIGVIVGINLSILILWAIFSPRFPTDVQVDNMVSFIYLFPGEIYVAVNTTKCFCIENITDLACHLLSSLVDSN